MAYIQNNIMANNIYRMYNKNTNAMAKSMERLSSGFRINRAGDDAAGLAISEKMRAQIRGLNMAVKNANDAISLIQTAEGALQIVHEMIQRMAELAVQAASDTNVDIDRNALQIEFENLQEEISQIAGTTKFNDTLLLDGSIGASASKTGYTLPMISGNSIISTANIDFLGPAGKNIQLSYVNSGIGDAVAASFSNNGDISIIINCKADSVITQQMMDNALANATNPPANLDEYKVIIDGGSVSFPNVTSSSTTMSGTMTQPTCAYSTNSNGVTFKNNKTGSGHLNKLQVFNNSGVLGATVQNNTTFLRLSSTAKYTAAQINTMLKRGYSDISAEFTGEKTGAEIMAGFDAAITVGDAIVGGSGAAGGGTVADGDGKFVIQVGAEEGHTLSFRIKAMDAKSLGIAKSDINIATREAAQAAITACREAVNKVSLQRAELGALHNRLEYKIAALENIAENLQAAESRIRDADMAKEMSEFIKHKILTQVSTALLAQANAAAQNVLQLLMP